MKALFTSYLQGTAESAAKLLKDSLVAAISPSSTLNPPSDSTPQQPAQNTPTKANSSSTNRVQQHSSPSTSASIPLVPPPSPTISPAKKEAWLEAWSQLMCSLDVPAQSPLYSAVETLVKPPSAPIPTQDEFHPSLRLMAGRDFVGLQAYQVSTCCLQIKMC